MTAPATLQRRVGLLGAVLLGLGSMVGTGLFVSTAIVVETAGNQAILAVLLAAMVALCNGLNSAQLAAAHPVAGGTFEYGYRLLHPYCGFAAGWFFLCAKSASAATAALALATYAPHALGWNTSTVPTAIALVGAVALIVAWGVRLTNAVNFALIAVTLVGVGLFVGECMALPAIASFSASTAPTSPATSSGLFLGSALMFVAFTGYGRVATLGEEIVRPERNIPIAVLLTVVAASLLYFTVTWSITGPWQEFVNSNATALNNGTAQAARAAPLQDLAEARLSPTAAQAINIAAITAMFAVLLNLLLGLSRMALAMGRRRDLPPVLAQLSARRNPTAAVAFVAVIIALIALVGDVRTTWTFSAITVLLYYSVTNLAALRLPAPQRRFPRALAVVGLAGCIFLAAWVPWPMWLAAAALLLVGFVLRTALHRITADAAQ